MADMTTNSKVVLITGGATGIGAASVKEFISKGWRVVVVDLEVAPHLGSPEVLCISGDITSDKVRELAVNETIARFGRLDVLINNAGVGLYASATSVPLALFSRLLDVNVVAPLAMAQLVIPIMRRQGEGTIVNVGSVAGHVSLPWAAAYSASKSALHSLHDALRCELRSERIHLVKVCPGIVDTEFRNHVLAGTAPAPVMGIRRIVSPDLVAKGILRAVERRRSHVFVPRIGGLFTLLGFVAPWLMDFYLSRFSPVANTVHVAAPLRTCAPDKAPPNGAAHFRPGNWSVATATLEHHLHDVEQVAEQIGSREKAIDEAANSAHFPGPKVRAHDGL